MSALASIAAMPERLRSTILALILVGASAGLFGCGGNGGPDPSIPADSAQTLLAKISEIQANVDVGSCLVAEDKTLRAPKRSAKWNKVDAWLNKPRGR